MGKLVVFWSPWHGQAKVTANMGAVACLLNSDTNDRVIMSHSQFSMADLEGMFNYRITSEKRKTIYGNSGLSALILRVKQSWLNEEVIEECLLPVASTTGFYMLPGTEAHADVLKESDTEELVFALLGRDIKNYYEWVFVDASAGNSKLSMRLLDAADVVVVNLSQNAATWERFAVEYPKIAEKKNALFVLGGYDDASRYNKKNFTRICTFTTPNNIGAVPYNTGLMDAISDGAVAKFIFANEGAKKGDENYEFIAECRAIGTKIQEIARKGSV